MNYIKIICMFLVSALLFTATGVAYVTGASSRPVVNTVSENTFSNGTLVPNSTLPLETTVVKPIENIEPVPAVVRGKRSIREDIDDGDFAEMRPVVRYDTGNEALNTIVSALKKLVDAMALSKGQMSRMRRGAREEQLLMERENGGIILNSLNKLADKFEALDRTESTNELILKFASETLVDMELLTLFDRKCSSFREHSKRIIVSIKRDMDVKGKLDIIPFTEKQNDQLEEIISNFKEIIHKVKRMKRRVLKRLTRKLKKNPSFVINDYGYELSEYCDIESDDELSHYNYCYYEAIHDIFEGSSELVKSLEALKEYGKFFEHLSDFVIYFSQDMHCFFDRMEAQMTYIGCKNGLLPKKLCPEDEELSLRLQK